MPEASIQHISEHLIGLQGTVNRLSEHNAKQSVDIAQINSNVTQIKEAIAGNEQLGHLGIVGQLAENRKAIEAQQEELLKQQEDHLNFKLEIEKKQAKYGKTMGFIAGVGVVLGFFAKWALAKLAILFT